MKNVVPVLFLALFAATLHAQTAKDMDLLLADETVSFARASRYVLPSAGFLPAAVSEADAFKAALEWGWLPAGADPGAPCRLDGTGELVVRAFSLEGGLLYRLFPGPRYAYRELVYRRYIQGRRDPGQTVPGARLVHILGRALDAKGGGE